MPARSGCAPLSPGQPVERTLPRDPAAGETGAEQVAAGRRFPVEHLAGTEHTRQGLEHQRLVHGLEAHAAGAADGLVDRPRRAQVQRQRLDQRGQARRIGPRRLVHQLVQQPGLDTVQPQPRLQVRGQRPRAARPRQFARHPIQAARGQQVQMQGGAAMGFDGVAQLRRRRIDQAAFDAVGRDDELPRLTPGRAIRAPQFDGHRFQRVAGKACGEVLAPAGASRRVPRRDLETAVRRAQGRQLDAGLLQPWHPGAVRAQPRPAGTTECEHQHVGAHAGFALGRAEAQQPRPRGVGRRLPAQPAVAHVELHTLGTQPVQPGTQQGRGLHLLREHPPRAADEGVDAQPGHPVAQLLRREATQQGVDLARPGAIAADEGLEILGMSEVQPAFAGEQEFAPDRRHAVVEMHRRTAHGQHLGGHQAGGPAADHDGAACVGHAREAAARMRQTVRQGRADATHEHPAQTSEAHAMSLTALRRLILPGLLAPAVACAADAVPRCAAHAPSQLPLVVELYTSEGCSSCPPADRWLSGLKARPEAVALAFHVDYWDRLGWKDRFSSAAYSQRQAQLQRSSGARTVYTPQVVVDGLDRPGWRGLKLAAGGRARERDAAIAPGARRPGLHGRSPGSAWRADSRGRLLGADRGWPQHRREVRGEPRRHPGARLRGARIRAGRGLGRPQPARAEAAVQPDASRSTRQHPRHVNLVLVDADSGRPLQALKLGC